MKLATFLPPGASDPQAGEVRGDEIVAFETGSILDRLISEGALGKKSGRGLYDYSEN